jgi:biopolymer transport protein ExbD
MITRPLDLASRLRPEPRNFDWLFYVNIGALVLFFALFGSPFVLAPGLGVDFRLPVAPGAGKNARPPSHVISVLNSGQIFTSSGRTKLEELDAWFAEQAKTTKEPVLLVRGDQSVPVSLQALIGSSAKRAGFVEVLWAAVDPLDRGTTGGR